MEVWKEFVALSKASIRNSTTNKSSNSSICSAKPLTTNLNSIRSRTQALARFESQFVVEPFALKPSCFRKTRFLHFPLLAAPPCLLGLDCQIQSINNWSLVGAIS